MRRAIDSIRKSGRSVSKSILYSSITEKDHPELWPNVTPGRLLADGVADVWAIANYCRDFGPEEDPEPGRLAAQVCKAYDEFLSTMALVDYHVCGVDLMPYFIRVDDGTYPVSMMVRIWETIERARRVGRKLKRKDAPCP